MTPPKTTSTKAGRTCNTSRHIRCISRMRYHVMRSFLARFKSPPPPKKKTPDIVTSHDVLSLQSKHLWHHVMWQLLANSFVLRRRRPVYHSSKTRHFYISHRPPLLLGVDTLSTSSWWSILGVGFGSVFVISDWNWPKTHQESTYSRPLTRWSVGVLSSGGVKVCGWNKSVYRKQ